MDGDIAALFLEPSRSALSDICCDPGREPEPVPAAPAYGALAFANAELLELDEEEEELIGISCRA